MFNMGATVYKLAWDPAKGAIGAEGGGRTAVPAKLTGCGPAAQPQSVRVLPMVKAKLL